MLHAKHTFCIKDTLRTDSHGRMKKLKRISWKTLTFLKYRGASFAISWGKGIHSIKQWRRCCANPITVSRKTTSFSCLANIIIRHFLKFRISSQMLSSIVLVAASCCNTKCRKEPTMRKHITKWNTSNSLKKRFFFSSSKKLNKFRFQQNSVFITRVKLLSHFSHKSLR